ncbi:hypothetical protein Tco_1525885 [Tanacetum coccineum]
MRPLIIDTLGLDVEEEVRFEMDTWPGLPRAAYVDYRSRGPVVCCIDIYNEKGIVQGRVLWSGRPLSTIERFSINSGHQVDAVANKITNRCDGGCLIRVDLSSAVVQVKQSIQPEAGCL